MYNSTRSVNVKATAKNAIRKGLADDGGLFVLPNLGEGENLESAAAEGATDTQCCDVLIKLEPQDYLGKSYNEVVKTVFSKLLDDFSSEEINDCIKNAYTGTFENDEVAPVKKVGNMFVLELFHGPTSAFKDVALTMLPQLMSKSLAVSGKKALILTATSGDTGKAAMNGFADVENTAICVYYPHGGVSAVQHMQMATQKGANVDVFAVEGNFDDAQRGVKELFMDEELNAYAAEKGVELSSANSINIGRLMPQIIYYFSSYAQLVKDGQIGDGDKIIFSVPTGNFGDVLAGYYAYLMGLPVEKFIVASNKNDVLDEFIKTGTYDANREFYKTNSPSMDILVSSNLERLLYYASGKNTEKVAGWMQELKENGKYTIDDATKGEISKLFLSGSASEEKTLSTIHEVYQETDYVLDTHSAISYAIAKEYADAGKTVVSLSTASPYKFPQAVMSALGEDITDEWEALEKLKVANSDPCPAALANLKNAEVLHDAVIEKQQMRDTVIAAIDKLAG
ncbi:MAG: threonine synthase [Phoenicibacter congonensis]|uniref:Threonine synthase n=1 Tax=Phoenicibacter congonensis TaxID=1944646 RepID=A0AA43RKA2_9ACTN|nr:threonine synthase [Phoenicibacter congonensis]